MAWVALGPSPSLVLSPCAGSQAAAAGGHRSGPTPPGSGGCAGGARLCAWVGTEGPVAVGEGLRRWYGSGRRKRGQRRQLRPVQDVDDGGINRCETSMAVVATMGAGCARASACAGTEATAATVTFVVQGTVARRRGRPCVGVSVMLDVLWVVVTRRRSWMSSAYGWWEWR
jgi:hypothetical protein